MESVKRPNGVPVPEYEGGYLEKRNFGLNYHQVFYHESYDDNTTSSISVPGLKIGLLTRKADDECSRQPPSTIRWIDHDTENDLRRNFQYRSSGSTSGIDVNAFILMFQDLGLKQLVESDSPSQNQARSSNLLAKYDKNGDGRLKWDDTVE